MATDIVFVVDDDAAVRELLRMSLKLKGYDVEVFDLAGAFLAERGVFAPRMSDYRCSYARYGRA